MKQSFYYTYGPYRSGMQLGHIEMTDLCPVVPRASVGKTQNLRAT